MVLPLTHVFMLAITHNILNNITFENEPAYVIMLDE